MGNAIKITALKYYLQYDIYLMKKYLFHVYLVPNLVMDRESETGAENKQDIKDFTPKAKGRRGLMSIVNCQDLANNYKLQ